MDTFSSKTQLEKRLVLSATMKRIPLGGAFELLPLCNMNCRMCFLRLSPEEMLQQGRLRRADEWLALAEQAKAAGLLFLLLTGGEPFLYPEFKKLYEGLCKLGLIITINSNGTLITEEFADHLAAHRPRRINITLYGSSDEVYGRLCGNPHGFTQTMQAIERLKSRGIDIKLNGSLTRYNRDDMENIQRVARELEIPIEIDSYMFPCIRKGSVPFDASSRLTATEAAECFLPIKQNELPPERFCTLLKQMESCYVNADAPEERPSPEPMPCRAGLSSFWVNWKGHMTPCVFMEVPAIPAFEQGFAASWEYIKQERMNIHMPAKCSACPKRPACTVCAAAVMNETGGMQDAPPYLCEYTEKKLELVHALLTNEGGIG